MLDSPSEATIRPSRRLRPDPEGVSEILGQVFIFGILSVMMVLSLVAFSSAQKAVQATAVDLHARSVAARVAGVVVQSAVLAERQGNSTNITYRVDLPLDLEGAPYVIGLQSGSNELVWANATSLGIRASTGLYAAGQPASFSLCPSRDVPGGPINVRFGVNPTYPARPCLFLETAP